MRYLLRITQSPARQHPHFNNTIWKKQHGVNSRTYMSRVYNTCNNRKNWTYAKMFETLECLVIIHTLAEQKGGAGRSRHQLTQMGRSANPFPILEYGLESKHSPLVSWPQFNGIIVFSVHHWSGLYLNGKLCIKSAYSSRAWQVKNTPKTFPQRSLFIFSSVVRYLRKWFSEYQHTRSEQDSIYERSRVINVSEFRAASLPDTEKIQTVIVTLLAEYSSSWFNNKY